MAGYSPRTRSIASISSSTGVGSKLKPAASLMRSFLEGGDITLVVRSTNIPLHELDPQQRGYGVFVRERGK